MLCVRRGAGVSADLQRTAGSRRKCFPSMTRWKKEPARRLRSGASRRASRLQCLNLLRVCMSMTLDRTSMETVRLSLEIPRKSRDRRSRYVTRKRWMTAGWPAAMMRSGRSGRRISIRRRTQIIIGWVVPAGRPICPNWCAAAFAMCRLRGWMRRCRRRMSQGWCLAPRTEGQGILRALTSASISCMSAFTGHS